jgi:leucyl-tRNA synthetase
VQASAIPAQDVPSDLDPKVATVLRQIHRTIASVGDDLEKFRFNSAVARIRELTNGVGDIDRTLTGGDAVFRFGVGILAQLINPLTPHIAEEVWELLGNTTILAQGGWPTHNPAFLEDDVVTLAVQVSGKLRDTITVPKAADQAACMGIAMTSAGVQRQLEGKTVRKVIFVPGKILNIVAS